MTITRAAAKRRLPRRAGTPKHIRLNVRHQRWLAEIEQLNAARGMLPLPAHELIERALEAHARQLAQDNVESSVERMRRLSHSITVKKESGGEGYKVLRHGAYIGRATVSSDGEVTDITSYGRGSISLGVTLNELDDLKILVSQLIREGKFDTDEDPINIPDDGSPAPGGDQ